MDMKKLSKIFWTFFLYVYFLVESVLIGVKIYFGAKSKFRAEIAAENAAEIAAETLKFRFRFRWAYDHTIIAYKALQAINLCK